MKFSEMSYKRPDLEQIKQEYKELSQKFPSCGSAQEQMELIKKHEKISSFYETMSSLAYIRSSINTNDEFYDKEQAFFDEFSPVVQEYVHEFYRVVVQSKFRAELAKTTGELFFKNLEISLKVYSPDIIKLMQEENRLVTEYEKLLASAKIPMNEEECNLSEIIKYHTSTNREIRKEAWTKTGEFFKENSEKLDDIYDRLVKSRTKQAEKLGYDNFVQLGYDRLGRNCYGPKDVAKFREQIAEDLVPKIRQLKEEQAKRLGLVNLKFYDDDMIFADGNPNPHGTEKELVQKAQKMYHEMSGLTGEYFDFMIENELFDLASRKGKAGGGYCTDLPDYHCPFIFANFNGTAEDVGVLTHEAGHGFESYQARNMLIRENALPTMEAAEVHSMSMELFSRPWDKYFFEEEAKHFQIYQLEKCLDFIPYGTMVDEFQTTMYEQPELTPDERRMVWKKLEQKYRPWVDFEEIPYFKDGGYYQWKHHIYSFPMYYIDYCLAQTVALEFWSASEKDWKEAFERYVGFVDGAGTKTFVNLVKDAGLIVPFDKGCVAKVAEEAMNWLEKNKE